jgi:multidrug transporter EmrE-like cation transporter
MESTHKSKAKISDVFLLQLIIVIYTLSGIAAKYASHFSFLSLDFIGIYAIEIAILGVYAVLWQQAIKKFDLSIAYANRGVAIFWSLVWSTLIFHEQITAQNIIGVCIIFIGTFIVNTSNSHKAEGAGGDD